MLKVFFPAIIIGALVFKISHHFRPLKCDNLEQCLEQKEEDLYLKQDLSIKELENDLKYAFSITYIPKKQKLVPLLIKRIRTFESPGWYSKISQERLLKDYGDLFFLKYNKQDLLSSISEDDFARFMIIKETVPVDKTILPLLYGKDNKWLETIDWEMISKEDGHSIFYEFIENGTLENAYFVAKMFDITKIHWDKVIEIISKGYVISDLFKRDLLLKLTWLDNYFKINWNEKNERGQNVWWYIKDWHGQEDLISFFKNKKVPIFYKDKKGQGLGFYKMLKNAPEYDLIILSNLGASFKGVTTMGANALMLSIEKDYIELFDYLILNKKEINKKDNQGQTSLMYAVRGGNIYYVRRLLDAGAKIHLKDKMGRTALHWAAHAGHLEVVSILIKFGANLD